jgi:uncharacterized damage-inducible protein DinB
MTLAVRPESAEVPASYAGYVGKIRDGEDLMAVLAGQLDEVRSAFGRFPEARGSYRYAPGKWSVKELLGHLSDTERIFCYRALRFARGDATPLPGFDENAYVPTAEFDARPLAELVREFQAIRTSTIALAEALPPAAWERRGQASGKSISTRALVYIMVGHVTHHLGVLRERYRLSSAPDALATV